VLKFNHIILDKVRRPGQFIQIRSQISELPHIYTHKETETERFVVEDN